MSSSRSIGKPTSYGRLRIPPSFNLPDKFAEDWGASGVYKNAGTLQIREVDSCDSGVVFVPFTIAN